MDLVSISRHCTVVITSGSCARWRKAEHTGWLGFCTESHYLMASKHQLSSLYVEQGVQEVSGKSVGYPSTSFPN